MALPVPDPRRAVGGSIAFRDVEFRYPGAAGSGPARHLRSTALPGETTGHRRQHRAAASPRSSTSSRGSTTRPKEPSSSTASTSGRSTAPTCGSASAFIPQKAFLFSGTVASNLRFGDQDATDEELWHALEIAQARDFVEEMEGGLEAPITQGGANLSGGQRQRLAIARALVKRAEIFIFDDAFSALDYATDARLRAALARELGWATSSSWPSGSARS